MARKTRKTTAASTVRNIRRNSRKRYKGEEKIRIVLEGGLRGEETTADFSRAEGAVKFTLLLGGVHANTRMSSIRPKL
jgi:hypothetical protein